MSQDQYGQQALIQMLLTSMMPEWSISKQAYQPFDIANQTSQTNILQDQFQLMENPLMQIMNGTFDYSLLDDVEGERGEAPETPNLSLMGSNPAYAGLVGYLSEGTSAQESAMAAAAEQMAAEQGVAIGDLDSETVMASPQYTAMLDVAKTLQPEVAAQFQYQSSGGAGPQKSDIAKQFEAMGISSDQTPDSYFSDSIDQDRVREAEGQASSQRAIENFLMGREQAAEFEGENPFMEGLGEAGPAADSRVQASLPKPQPVIGSDSSLEDILSASRSGPSLGDALGFVKDQWERSGPSDRSGQDSGVKTLEAAVQRAIEAKAGRGEAAPDREVGRYFGGGDPRDPQSQTYKAMKWDEDKKRGRGGRPSADSVQKYVNAKQGRVHGNSTAIERGLIDRERASGRSIQQDALTKLLLAMPR